MGHGSLVKQCVCIRKTAVPIRLNGMDFLKCTGCGIMRQDVRMTPAQYKAYYQNDYHGKEHNHTYQQDLGVAYTRLRKYRVREGMELLDVGCSNGAFVAAVRERTKAEAVGVELVTGLGGDNIYEGCTLRDVLFPQGKFDVVTAHDIFEHVVDARGFLLEIKRVLREGGYLYLDMPDYWVDAGNHHWRPIQHLWYPTVEQMVALLNSVGLVVESVNRPIPGKVVFYCKRETTHPLPNKIKGHTIIVPPGIGDVYWSMVKLPGIIKVHNLENPTVYTMSLGDRDRSAPFVERFPYVHSGGYTSAMGRQDPVWREGYLQDGRTVFPGAGKADYFIIYNGVTRHGRALEDVDKAYGHAWYQPMHMDLVERAYAVNKYGGDYIVALFSNHGMFKHWVAEFGKAAIMETLEKVHQATGKHIILMGSEWDAPYWADDPELNCKVWLHNWVGQTTLSQGLGLLRGACGVIGWPSGFTIMATVYKVPTLIVWNKYFMEGFWQTACPRDAYGEWYHTADTAMATPAGLANTMGGICKS